MNWTISTSIGFDFLIMLFRKLHVDIAGAQCTSTFKRHGEPYVGHACSFAIRSATVNCSVAVREANLMQYDGCQVAITLAPNRGMYCTTPRCQGLL